MRLISPRRDFARCVTAGLVLLAAFGCHHSGYKSFQGSTMGTYYRVVADCTRVPAHGTIQTELRLIDEVMSNYREDSWVEQFNRHPPGSWFDVPPSLVHVVATAHRVSEVTSGRFDITVEPLVSQWGFGSSNVVQKPSDATIKQLLESIDYRELEFRLEPPALRKSSWLTIDLSGIGKGYGVDRITELLQESDCANYLVDIGGEIRVYGVNQSGKAWQVGIEVPDNSTRIHTKISLRRGALATTGDYRNFRTYGDQIYTHVLDAKTGYPVKHSLSSVTVHMPTAIEADAYATALFVLGENEAFRLAVENDFAVLFLIWRESRRTYESLMTPKMEQLIETTSLVNEGENG